MKTEMEPLYTIIVVRVVRKQNETHFGGKHCSPDGPMTTIVPGETAISH